MNSILVDAELCLADLRQASFVDSCLDGANLSGAMLWETQRSGWSIKNIVCNEAFWDRDGKKSTEYRDCEFERTYTERPRIVLRYPGGMSPIDILMLPLIVERLQAEHPGCALHLRSVQDDGSGATVTITVENRADRDDSAYRQEVVRLQAKLECIEAERDRLADRFMPQLLNLIAVSRQTNIIGQIASQEAGIVSRDTYNVHGQAGAVGRHAHAHDMTFQQVQAGGLDLPKLAEELERLRAAMSQKAERSREQDKALGAVAEAADAAAGGDGAGVLRHLKRAGAWTLEVAKDIGVDVAAEVIKKAMLSPG